MQLESSSARGVYIKVRCYSVCGKPGYNACTCQKAVEASDSAISNVIIVGSQCCYFAIQDSIQRVVKKWPLACPGHSLIMHVSFLQAKLKAAVRDKSIARVKVYKVYS